ncbi:MAG: phosphatidylserine decarboxylase family protein [Candidatus Marinimicrobia bacterium]|nr:phosphatidylserine decarboxylase family protein [Candidatus Neomarinimicrobiota bacterium]MBT5956758.1 phosphatidylserine decarboxylase family protein [Candidatus Neomarinimicrobiota bacterium]MBT6870393.1 phosphatidylserine decarboxylase family protein [Candidatus Neomarinimicrobiota bacterium]MBT7377291.1 phosphatidylserine decarboxylase family protein [Candidatus Neomarinimicrobiota bacterium]
MIAAEGKIILVPVILLALATTGISVYSQMGGSGLKGVNIALWVFILFSLYFFRDPVRIPLGEANKMVSPADGKVVQILDVDDPEIGNAKQISIFLSVFNVHCQRVPLAGKVISTFYNPGKFLAAFNHKASMDNEQTAIVFETVSGRKYKVKQIAGLIARRILNYMEPEMVVEKGERLGFIRFGSRVDIIVPPNFKINVSLGDIVEGNLSIIGEFE